VAAPSLRLQLQQPAHASAAPAPPRPAAFYFAGYSGPTALAAPNVKYSITLFKNNSMALCIPSSNALVGLAGRVSGAPLLACASRSSAWRLAPAKAAC
jgi:hypothetical protein